MKHLRSSKISKGAKEARLKEEGGRGRRGGQKGWPYRCFMPPEDTQVLQDFTLGLQRREDCISALPETPDRTEPEFEFSAKRRLFVSDSQLRLRLFDQIPVSRTGELEKRGRIGGVKERKERGKG